MSFRKLCKSTTFPQPQEIKIATFSKYFEQLTTLNIYMQLLRVTNRVMIFGQPIAIQHRINILYFTGPDNMIHPKALRAKILHTCCRK